MRDSSIRNNDEHFCENNNNNSDLVLNSVEEDFVLSPLTSAQNSDSDPEYFPSKKKSASSTGSGETKTNKCRMLTRLSLSKKVESIRPFLPIIATSSSSSSSSSPTPPGKDSSCHISAIVDCVKQRTSKRNRKFKILNCNGCSNHHHGQKPSMNFKTLPDLNPSSHLSIEELREILEDGGQRDPCKKTPIGNKKAATQNAVVSDADIKNDSGGKSVKMQRKTLLNCKTGKRHNGDGSLAKSIREFKSNSGSKPKEKKPAEMKKAKVQKEEKSKRKRQTCRKQFRHKDITLYKLGADGDKKNDPLQKNQAIHKIFLRRSSVSASRSTTINSNVSVDQIIEEVIESTDDVHSNASDKKCSNEIVKNNQDNQNCDSSITNNSVHSSNNNGNKIPKLKLTLNSNLQYQCCDKNDDVPQLQISDGCVAKNTQLTTTKFVSDKKETEIGKHNLPIRIPERRSNIAEPLRTSPTKISKPNSDCLPEDNHFNYAKIEIQNSDIPEIIYVKTPILSENPINALQCQINEEKPKPVEQELPLETKTIDRPQASEVLRKRQKLKETSSSSELDKPQANINNNLPQANCSGKKMDIKETLEVSNGCDLGKPLHPKTKFKGGLKFSTTEDVSNKQTEFNPALTKNMPDIGETNSESSPATRKRKSFTGNRTPVDIPPTLQRANSYPNNCLPHYYPPPTYPQLPPEVLPYNPLIPYAIPLLSPIYIPHSKSPNERPGVIAQHQHSSPTSASKQEYHHQSMALQKHTINRDDTEVRHVDDTDRKNEAISNSLLKQGFDHSAKNSLKKHEKTHGINKQSSVVTEKQKEKKIQNGEHPDNTNLSGCPSIVVKKLDSNANGYESSKTNSTAPFVTITKPEANNNYVVKELPEELAKPATSVQRNENADDHKQLPSLTSDTSSITDDVDDKQPAMDLSVKKPQTLMYTRSNVTSQKMSTIPQIPCSNTSTQTRNSVGTTNSSTSVTDLSNSAKFPSLTIELQPTHTILNKKLAVSRFLHSAKSQEIGAVRGTPQVIVDIPPNTAKSCAVTCTQKTCSDSSSEPIQKRTPVATNHFVRSAVCHQNAPEFPPRNPKPTSSAMIPNSNVVINQIKTHPVSNAFYPEITYNKSPIHHSENSAKASSAHQSMIQIIPGNQLPTDLSLCTAKSPSPTCFQKNTYEKLSAAFSSARSKPPSPVVTPQKANVAMNDSQATYSSSKTTVAPICAQARAVTVNQKLPTQIPSSTNSGPNVCDRVQEADIIDYPRVNNEKPSDENGNYNKSMNATFSKGDCEPSKVEPERCSSVITILSDSDDEESKPELLCKSSKKDVLINNTQVQNNVRSIANIIQDIIHHRDVTRFDKYVECLRLILEEPSNFDDVHPSDIFPLPLNLIKAEVPLSHSPKPAKNVLGVVSIKDLIKPDQSKVATNQETRIIRDRAESKTEIAKQAIFRDSGTNTVETGTIKTEPFTDVITCLDKCDDYDEDVCLTKEDKCEQAGSSGITTFKKSPVGNTTSSTISTQTKNETKGTTRIQEPVFRTNSEQQTKPDRSSVLVIRDDSSRKEEPKNISPAVSFDKTSPYSIKNLVKPQKNIPVEIPSNLLENVDRSSVEISLISPSSSNDSIKNRPSPNLKHVTDHSINNLVKQSPSLAMTCPKPQPPSTHYDINPTVQPTNKNHHQREGFNHIGARQPECQQKANGTSSVGVDDQIPSFKCPNRMNPSLQTASKHSIKNIVQVQSQLASLQTSITPSNNSKKKVSINYLLENNISASKTLTQMSQRQSNHLNDASLSSSFNKHSINNLITSRPPPAYSNTSCKILPKLAPKVPENAKNNVSNIPKKSPVLQSRFHNILQTPQNWTSLSEGTSPSLMRLLQRSSVSPIEMNRYPPASNKFGRKRERLMDERSDDASSKRSCHSCEDTEEVSSGTMSPIYQSDPTQFHFYALDNNYSHNRQQARFMPENLTTSAQNKQYFESNTSGDLNQPSLHNNGKRLPSEGTKTNNYFYGAGSEYFDAETREYQKYLNRKNLYYMNTNYADTSINKNVNNNPIPPPFNESNVNKNKHPPVMPDRPAIHQNYPPYTTPSSHSSSSISKLTSIGKLKTEDVKNMIPKLQTAGILTADQYVQELTVLETHECPWPFLQYYTYVTRRQISSNQIPISFKIFIELHNSGHLKNLEVSFITYTKKCEAERKKRRENMLTSSSI